MKYNMFASSLTGTGHLMAGSGKAFTPCQDAYRAVTVPGEDVPEWKSKMNCHVLAIADGHGNPVMHGSSEFGSKIAVDVAVDAALQLAALYECTNDSEVFYQFPEIVVERWRERVLAHAMGRFPEMDLKDRFRSDADYLTYLDRIVTDYGSTLLTAIVIPDKKILVTAQIGDGDMVLISGNDPKQRPVKPVIANRDHEYGKNITDSLCGHDAVKKFAMSVMDGEKDAEVAVWLEKYVLFAATDGISGACESEQGFLEHYCKERMQMYLNAEDDAERKNYQEIFEYEARKEISSFSSDDITMAMLAVDCNAKEEVCPLSGTGENSGEDEKTEGDSGVECEDTRDARPSESEGDGGESSAPAGGPQEETVQDGEGCEETGGPGKMGEPGEEKPGSAFDDYVEDESEGSTDGDEESEKVIVYGLDSGTVYPEILKLVLETRDEEDNLKVEWNP